jgi:hypothetical protein
MRIPNFAAQLALKDSKVMDRLVKQYDIESANSLDQGRPHLPTRIGRYDVKFVNGAWVHVDYQYWYHSAGPFPSRKAAIAALPAVPR